MDALANHKARGAGHHCIGLNRRGEMDMNRTCTQCNREEGTTRCDKCNQMTCRACSVIIPIPRGEVEVKHSSCVRKRRNKNGKE